MPLDIANRPAGLSPAGASGQPRGLIRRGTPPMVDDRERDRRDAQRWREHQAGTTAADQPRLYRVRLFEGGWEVATGGGPYRVVLDLTPGAALEESARKLDELLRSLLRIAKVPADKATQHYLDVTEWDCTTTLFRWAITWPVSP
jgi:hypothetical protein